MCFIYLYINYFILILFERVCIQTKIYEKKKWKIKTKIQCYISSVKGNLSTFINLVSKSWKKQATSEIIQSIFRLPPQP